jgi:hypothetical protein
VLDLDLAQQLRAAGLPWEPKPGDRFVLPLPDMEDEIFILSNVIADVHRFENGNVIGFNGTTEWALDSVEMDDVVWLPREEQLRDLLGAAFVRLEPVTGGYAVTATAGGGEDRRFVDIDAERAYARAVLSRLQVARNG